MTSRQHMFAALFATVLLAPVLPATAQDTPETTEPTEETTESGAEIGLDMGTDTEAENQLGQLYLKETHGDWEIRCVRTETPEQDPCQMNQTLTDSEGNAVSEISLFPLPEAQAPAVAGATVAVPLMTLLTEDVRIAVDGGSERRYKFTWCDAQGCYARIGFRAEEVSAFRAGAGATVTIVPVAAPDQQVVLPLSLVGFTAAFESLTTS